ncbi:MAG TPA: chaperone modulator CbpM [Spirochaetia bacterium]|nr:chaperone modulator CbpM [Spirochaetia bacterium]
MKFYIKFCQRTFSPAEEIWLPVDREKISPLTLQKLVQMGCVDIQEGTVRVEHLHNILRMTRLRRHLGVNLTGAAVIMEMLGRLEELQRENERLRRQLGF